jgi:hypothetical protein
LNSARVGFASSTQTEIPYSEFLQRLDKGEVTEAIVTDKSITGVLSERAPATNEPRHFITRPLWNNELANAKSGRCSTGLLACWKSRRY